MKRYLWIFVFLVACAPPSHLVVRNWEEFIPEYDLNKNIAQDQKNCSIKEDEDDCFSVVKPIDNGKSFPDDCDWQDLSRVVDGDTLVLESGVRVRFIGIDTPESKHPQKPVEPFALEASKFTQSLLADSEAVCLIDSAIGDEYDKYGRRLAYIFSQHGLDVNAELLRVGLAKGYYGFPFDRKEAFKVIENQAKTQHRGVWGDSRH